MDLAVVATVFGVIFTAELPDKTMVATLVLSTRFRPLLVWLGVTGAFVVHVGIAVAAGGLLSLAPDRLVAAASGMLFAVGAVILLRVEPGEAAVERDVATGGPLRAIATSFAVLFVSEWGDLSQLATAAFAARFGDPVSVFAGALGALASVAALAVVAGRFLLRAVPLALVRRIAGVALVVLAVLALASAVRG